MLFLFRIFFQSIHEYIILILNINKLYGFLCPINFSNEKYIRVKKNIFLDIFLRKNRYQVFVNYSRIQIIREYKYYSYSYSQVLEFTYYFYSYSYRNCLHKSIPILICGTNYYYMINVLCSLKVVNVFLG